MKFINFPMYYELCMYEWKMGKKVCYSCLKLYHFMDTTTNNSQQWWTCCACGHQFIYIFCFKPSTLNHKAQFNLFFIGFCVNYLIVSMTQDQREIFSNRFFKLAICGFICRHYACLFLNITYKYIVQYVYITVPSFYLELYIVWDNTCFVYTQHKSMNYPILWFFFAFYFVTSISE